MFYTYLWLRFDGTPYYVGKGKGERCYRKGCPLLTKVYGYIYEPDKDRIIVQQHPSEEEAFIVEKFFIDYYGRRDLGTGILRNLTNGGEGSSGMNPEIKEATIEKIRVALTGNKNNLGKTLSQTSRNKIRDALQGNQNSKGAVRTEETKSKLKGRVVSAETRTKMSLAMLGNSNYKFRVFTPEYRENLSKALKGKNKKTVCVNGHPRVPENLYRSGSCRICTKNNTRNRRVRLRRRNDYA